MTNDDVATSDQELPVREKRPLQTFPAPVSIKRARSAFLPDEVRKFYEARDERTRSHGMARDILNRPDMRERALQILHNARSPTSSAHNPEAQTQTDVTPTTEGTELNQPPTGNAHNGDRADAMGETADNKRTSPAPDQQPEPPTIHDHPVRVPPTHTCPPDQQGLGSITLPEEECLDAPVLGSPAPNARSISPPPGPTPNEPIHDLAWRDLHGPHQENPISRTGDLSDKEDSDDESIQETSENRTASMETQHPVPQTRMRDLRRRVGVIVRWENFISCVAMSGKVRLNAYQYMFFVRCLRTANPTIRIRLYKSVTGSFWRKMLRHTLPRSEVQFVEGGVRRRRDKDTIPTCNAGNKSPEDCVRIAMPSEWAALDVSNDIFFRNVYEREDMGNPEAPSIEAAPIVQHRRTVCGTDITVWASYENALCPCHGGDKVRFNCLNHPTSNKQKPYDTEWTILPNPHTRAVAVEGYIGPIWLVGPNMASADKTKHTPEEMSMRKTLKDQIAPTYESIAQECSRQHTIESTQQDGRIQICPGDVCMFLRTEPSRDTDGVVCMLIASPVKRGYDQPAEKLVWLQMAEDSKGSAYARLVASTVVTSCPEWVSGDRRIPAFPKSSISNKGTSPDGTPYYIYRVALYADGFQQHKSLSDTRSVTGVYMLPLGLPLHLRRSSAATRVLTLIPDGKNARHVFKMIEDDLVQSASTGVDAVDPYGQRVRVYVDVVSFFADYPAVTEMTDVRGHMANAFCTFCTMHRRNDANGRNLLYSCLSHSRRLGYTRFDERASVIRATSPPESILKALGMSKEDTATASDAPLRRYSARVRALRRQGVVPPYPLAFDAFLSVAAAPDHLFTGLISDALYVCFMSLRDNNERERVEHMMLAHAYANSLQEDGLFLKWNNGTCAGLRSMTMSTRIGLLLCAVPLFDREFRRTKVEVFQLPGKLQKLISSVYYMPMEEADGPHVKERFNDEGVLRAHGQLHKTATEYIKLCRSIFRGRGNLGKELNKPNVHRALELCVLTIPSFGHARNCSEMVLESTHRSFKRWLETNTHANAHITGVERILLKDWLSRVHGLYMQWNEGDEQQRLRAEKGLLRLLVGRDALAMDMTRTGVEEFLKDFREAMMLALRDPVVDELASSTQWADRTAQCYTWDLSKLSEEVDPYGILESGMKLLQEYYVCNGIRDVDLDLYEEAKFASEECTVGGRKAYAYNKIKRGCAVSIVCKRSSASAVIIRGATMGEEDCVMKFFAVFYILRASNGESWCVVRELTRRGEGYSVTGNKVSVLLLGRRVRRVAAMHICDERCRAKVERQKVSHSNSILRGGMYMLFARQDGYPPHLG